VRILLTNDDGIDAAGLRALVAPLAEHGEVIVIAPLENQSGVARKITLSRPMAVDEVDVAGAAAAFAVDGTPVDCVRLAAHGLAGPPPDLVVSGANHGLNLGDDVTYSGTVAAAFEGHLLQVPAIAVSQQSTASEMGFVGEGRFDFSRAARFTGALVGALVSAGFPEGLLLSVNVPGGAPPRGAVVARLGKRIYGDRLEFERDADGRRHARIYGVAHGFEPGPGTDCQAVADGFVAITPLQLDLDVGDAAQLIASVDLDALVRG
jgi:5'-nucleotidase